jgi:hypothetical protein
MTLNFPAAPADGDIYLNYVYDATEGVWNANPRQLASRFVTSATTPAEPSNGDGWFNTTNGKTYIFYYDGTSGQWIESGYPVLGYQTLSNLSDTTIATPTTGQVLKYNGTDWVNGTDNAGKILQVVSTTMADTFSAENTAFTDVTGLTATITPTSANSKIYVSFTLNFVKGNSGGNTVYARMLRGGSVVFGGNSPGSRNAGLGIHWYRSDILPNNDIIHNVSGQFLDLPATTSATTYKIQVEATGAGTLVLVNRAVSDDDTAIRVRTASSITLMEVAA